jgi:hypothetical protein
MALAEGDEVQLEPVIRHALKLEDESVWSSGGGEGQLQALNSGYPPRRRATNRVAGTRLPRGSLSPKRLGDKVVECLVGFPHPKQGGEMVRFSLKKLFVLAAIAAALMIAGCGSSGDGETSSEGEGKALSATAYAKQAEAICLKAAAERDKKVQELEEEQPAGKNPNIVEELTRTVEPIFQEMVVELEGFEPPAGKQGDGYREWVKLVEVAVDKIDAPDPEGLEASVAAHHAAKRVGLKPCSLL